MVDLCQALEEAEVDESLSEVVATMRVLKSANGDGGNSLGPTLSACVEFKGSPVEALLDTRSPVTIVSSWDSCFRPWPNISRRNRALQSGQRQ